MGSNCIKVIWFPGVDAYSSFHILIPKNVRIQGSRKDYTENKPTKATARMPYPRVMTVHPQQLQSAE